MKVGNYKEKISWAVYLILCIICCLFVFNSSYSIFTTRTEYLDTTEPYELKSGETLSQQISGYSGTLKNLYVKFGTYGRVNNAQMIVCLMENDNLIQEWDIDTSELVDNAYKKFTLPKYYRMNYSSDYNLQITETYDEGNSVAVYLSAGGDNLRNVSGNMAIENRSICYQLESISLKNTHIFQLIAMIMMIIIFAFVVFNKGLNIVERIIVIISVTVIANVVIIDLFEKINTEVRIVSFKNDGQTVELQAGETKIYELINKQCAFDILEIFFDGENKNGIHVVLKDADSGKTIIEKDVNDNSLIADSTNGRTAISLCPSKRIEKGNYEIVVENRSEVPVNLCTYGDNLNVVENKYTKIGYYIALFLILVLLAYVGTLSFFIMRDKPISIERFFLITVISLGICNFILFAPWNIPDAGSHYLASYRLSNIMLGFPKEQHWYGRVEDGQFYSNIWGKDNNPGMLGYTDLAYNFEPFCKDKTIEDFPYHSEKMEYYSMLSYWPQMLGITIGRLMGLSAIACSYMAKLMIFIFYVLGCMYAIRNTPIGKSIFAMIPLFPMSLMNSSAISYDPLVLITTLNLAAGIFALYKNPTSKKILFQVMVWSFMVGATKGGGYLILLPLVFVLINRSNIKNSLINISSIIGSGVFSILLFDKWLQIGKELFQLGSEGNGKMAAVYALEHPIKYMQMCWLTYLGNANTLLFDMIGSNLAWLEYTIPCYILLGIVVIALLYAILDEDEINLDKKFKYTFEFIVALIALTTPAMLLSWTNKGSTTIGGLQGRYYLPALAIAMLSITKFSLHNVNFSQIETEKSNLIKNKCLYMFSMLSCLAVYYMMRLYLRR